MACWLPYHLVTFLLVVNILNPFLMSCNTIDGLFFWLSIVQCLSLFHCIANPILYNFLSKNFRANLVSDLLSRISSPPFNSTADGVGRSWQKDRKLSNASTSHSEIGS